MPKPLTHNIADHNLPFDEYPSKIDAGSSRYRVQGSFEELVGFQLWREPGIMLSNPDLNELVKCVGLLHKFSGFCLCDTIG
jgi:hypothetical protein